MKNNTLVRRIGSGYALLILLLACAVGLTIFQVGKVREANQRLDAVRLPAVQSGIEMLNGANHAAAALRGWVLLGDSAFRDTHRNVWHQQVEMPLVRLDEALGQRAPDRERRERIHATLDRLAEVNQAVLRAENMQARQELLEISTATVEEVREHLNGFIQEQKTLMRADLDGIHGQIDLLNSLQWLLLLLGLATGIALAVAITRSISRPVNEAIAVADHIAGGDLETDVEVGGTRELASLGAALRSMRDSLRKREGEVQRHVWLSEGQRKLDEHMRGDKSLARLADDTVAAMAAHVGAHMGAFYRMDEHGDQLHLVGRFAVDPDAPNTFKVGNGLVGQAALNGELRLVEGLDPAHARIVSSFVSGPPAAVLVAPVSFEGNVTGVLELGRLSAFGERDLEFLRAALPSVGVAMNMASNRERIAELLEETQRQGEELQVQQEELQQSNEELEEQSQRLQAQQEELQVTNEELEERSQAMEQQNHALATARMEVERKAEQLEMTGRYKSEFLANMSHELRTPLNSLLILSNHLAQNKEGNLAPAQVESAQVIAKSGHDLLRLINDILDLAKVEAGKMDLEIAPIALADLAADVRASFDHMASEKGLAFQVQVADDAPVTVWSDAQRIGQVVKNLVSNALKFTATGGVTVSLHGRGAQEWGITVADTGIGIAPDKQQLIFEAFQQADGGTSRQYGGTGLGLSIARELARLLGGRIAMESTLGQGSTFTLVLPRHAATAPARDAAPAPLQQAPPADGFIGYPALPDQRNTLESGQPVVLIIEDDEVFAGVLAREAKARGFQFLAAATGEDGLALARKYRPHAVVLDMSLPGMDGNAVLLELKGDPDLRHIPVHIMSVNDRTLDPIRSGAVEYLVKPVSQEQMDDAFARIEDLVRRKMKNLLIVEDDPAQRRAIVTLIGNGDVKCLEAGTIAEALSLLEAGPVDCIVLDIGLPDGDGLALMHRLKERMGAQLPPIVVYTGKELTRQENDALRQYADTVIVKGIRSEERLLDETALFLHRAVKDLPAPKQAMIMERYDPAHILKDCKVLLVDDDMRNVFALTKVLVGKGCHVLRAENGKAALQLLEEQPDVNLVLMDIMMPEMDGYACMRAIRSQERFAHLPIIALTAKAMKEDRRKCIDAGASDYVTKPVDIERLFSLMRIWTGRDNLS